MSLWFVNHVVRVDEVDPDDGFPMKPLDYLDAVDHSVVPDLNFHVIGLVFPVGPLTLLIGPLASTSVVNTAVVNEMCGC